MELEYKTQVDSNPYGKARVYFSCHPADFEKYFQTLSREILKRQNCAIWYDDKMKEPENVSEFLMNLSQMQLFIIPITRAYLCEQNRAYDLEFTYAMKKNIPVLPIMMEADIENLFNEKCKDIQYLNLYNRGIEDAYYSDRLTHYLSTILVGDKLAQEVRADFDAYIFLSYRKKDKEYAQQLMQLIHKNDVCRDVAIWYDEYLIAGENFNDAIEEAIKKSDFFGMTVTPNLVNEENYVMTTEYPIAVKEGKTIIPIELTKTDRHELIEKYEGIPECIDAKDEQALVNVMSMLMESYIVKERKNEPRHLFLIGLAYLSGIDVEINKRKGIELITIAAEAGLPEAMSKLANIYVQGDGTKINHKTAQEWWKRLAITTGKAYYANPEKGYDEYFNALISLAMESHLYCGDIQTARGAYLKIVDVITDKCAITKRKYSFLPVIFLEIGDTYLAVGELQQAYKYYNDARLEIENNPVYNDPSDMLMRSRLQLAYHNLGYISQKYKKYVESWEYFQKSLVIAKSMVEKEGEIDDRMALAGVYGHLGTNCVLRGDTTSAHQYYIKSLSICKNITEETNDYWLSLAAAYQKMGHVYMHENNFIDAEAQYRASIAICDKFHLEITGAIEEKDLIGKIYLDFGAFLRVYKKDQEAEQYLSKSLSIHKELWENFQLWDSKRALGRVYYELGCVGEGNTQYLKRSCKIMVEEMYKVLMDEPALSEKWAVLKELLTVRTVAKQRIREIKVMRGKIKITSIFKKKYR